MAEVISLDQMRQRREAGDLKARSSKDPEKIQLSSQEPEPEEKITKVIDLEEMKRVNNLTLEVASLEKLFEEIMGAYESEDLDWDEARKRLDFIFQEIKKNEVDCNSLRQELEDKQAQWGSDSKKNIQKYGMEEAAKRYDGRYIQRQTLIRDLAKVELKIGQQKGLVAVILKGRGQHKEEA